MSRFTPATARGHPIEWFPEASRKTTSQTVQIAIRMRTDDSTSNAMTTLSRQVKSDPPIADRLRTPEASGASGGGLRRLLAYVAAGDEQAAADQAKMLVEGIEAAKRTVAEVFTDIGDLAALSAIRRPGFSRLLHECRRGDLVCVAGFAVLAPHISQLHGPIERLLKAGALIFAMAPTIVLRPEKPEILEALRILAAVGTEFRAAHSEATRRGMAERAAAGRIITPRPPLGKRRTTKRGPTGDRIITDVWDSTQCAIIAEIWRRRSAGECFTRIARDFYLRRLLKPDRRLWVKYSGRGRRRCLDTGKLRRAYRAYQALTPLQQAIGLESSDFTDEELRVRFPQIAAQLDAAMSGRQPDGLRSR